MTDSPSSPRFSRAFTLIELLIVIAIIVVLMGLLFPVVNSAKDQARRAQAKNDVTQIVNGIKSYYTEYGKYPITSNVISAQSLTTGSNDAVYSKSQANPQDAASLFNILANNTALDTTGTTVTSMNPRGIAFLEIPPVKDEKNPKSGASQTASGPDGIKGGFYDPWGTLYQVAIDASYDNMINAQGAKIQGFYSDTNFSPISTGAVAWSFGKDKALGTNGNGTYNGSDDVISWQ